MSKKQANARKRDKALLFALAQLKINFRSLKDANAAYHALLQEADFTHRGSSSVELQGKSVLIRIDSEDPVSLRASLNSYLRLIYIIKSVDENTNREEEKQ